MQKSEPDLKLKNMKANHIYIAISDYQLPNPIMEYGLHLAKALGRSAGLLGLDIGTITSIPSPVTNTGILYPTAAILNESREEVQRKVAMVLENARATWKSTTGFTQIKPTSSRLLDWTQMKDPYLLVVGGRSDLNTFNEWFGTFETKVAEDAICPVLVVPPEMAWKPVHNMLYIMDLQDATVENMRFLTTIAEGLQAQLTVAVISEERIKEKDTRFLTTIKTFRQLLGYKDVTYQQVFAEEAAEVVQKLVVETNADWLSFEQKGKTFLERLFNDYNTKRLILQSEIPVLVF